VAPTGKNPHDLKMPRSERDAKRGKKRELRKRNVIRGEGKKNSLLRWAREEEKKKRAVQRGKKEKKIAP